MKKLLVILIEKLARLPLSTLYKIGSLLSFIVFRVLGYRKKVVYSNLKNSFPEKSDKEIAGIAREFFAHFGDLVVESIKGFAITESELRKFMTVSGTEILEKYHAKGKSVALAVGHYGNWELGALRFTLASPHQVYGVYAPIKDKYMNDFMRSNRSRFGAALVPMKETMKEVARQRQEHELVAWGMIGDQAPRAHKGYWMEFLNQDTPVFLGTEKLVREEGMALVYATIHKLEQGKYHLEMIDIMEDGTNTRIGEITELHTRKLEQAIRKEPAYWLWTHKRWKRKRPADMPQEMIDPKNKFN